MNDIIYIYGTHALTEALTHMPEAVREVLIAPEANAMKIRELARQHKIPVGVFSEKAMPREFDRGAVHQGVVGGVIRARLMRPYKDFIRDLKITPDTALVLLGEVEDPQNVGAVIRSAGAFGVAGVLIPEHNQAQVGGAVVKVSAGMAFRTPLVSIGNVNTVVRDLKERGFWIFGLDGSAKESIADEKFDAPTVLLLGNEADGIRAKTRELCDKLLSIPMNPQCESLNASASAAVALYAWSTKYPKVFQ